jgi:DNA-binding NarL/FixJ family response regulator
MTALLTTAVGMEDAQEREQEQEENREYEPLTPKELEVMVLFSNPYYEYVFISDKLSITVGTLKSHINHIFDKLEETDRYSASLKFFRLYPDHRGILDELLTKTQ